MIYFILEKFINSNIEIICKEKLLKYISLCINKNNKQRIKYKTEYHHILPRSLFPDYADLKSNEWNGVHLLYEDHYVAHSILAEALNSYEMLSAWIMMNDMNTKTNKIIKPEEIIGKEKYSYLREMTIRKRSEYLAKEIIDDEGNITTVAKEYGKKVSCTLKKEIVDENGNITTVAKERAKKNKETVTKEIVDEKGNITSIAKERALVSANTMITEINDTKGNITTLAKERAIIASNKMKKKRLDENGNITTIYKESGKKGSITLNKEVVLEDGTKSTIIKERAKKKSITDAKKGKKYNLYHIHLGLLSSNVPNSVICKISQQLPKRDKDNYIGKTIAAQKVLIKNYNSLLIGLYTEEIKTV